MHIRLRHHLPIPSQYREDGSWVRGKRECGLVVGRRGAYFGVLAQALLGKMSCWNDISPKRGKHKLESLGDISPKRDKHELESLGACYRSW